MTNVWREEASSLHETNTGKKIWEFRVRKLTEKINDESLLDHADVDLLLFKCTCIYRNMTSRTNREQYSKHVREWNQLLKLWMVTKHVNCKLLLFRNIPQIMFPFPFLREACSIYAISMLYAGTNFSFHYFEFQTTSETSISWNISPDKIYKKVEYFSGSHLRFHVKIQFVPKTFQSESDKNSYELKKLFRCSRHAHLAVHHLRIWKLTQFETSFKNTLYNGIEVFA